MRLLVAVCAVLVLSGCERTAAKKPEVVSSAPTKPKPWKMIRRDKDSALLITTEVQKVGNFKRIWFGMLLPEPQDYGEKKYTSRNDLMEIDCEQRRTRILSTQVYAKSGDNVASEDRDQPPWGFTAPDAVGSDVVAEVCGRDKVPTIANYESMKEAEADYAKYIGDQWEVVSEKPIKK